MTTNIKLPDLIGTEKQIAWADNIRKAALDRGEARNGPISPQLLELAARFGVSEDHMRRRHEGILAEVVAMIHKIRTTTDAKWFIDNRAKLESGAIYSDVIKYAKKYLYADLLAELEIEEAEKIAADRDAATKAREEIRAKHLKRWVEKGKAEKASDAIAKQFYDAKWDRIEVRDDDLLVFGRKDTIAKGFLADNDVFITHVGDHELKHTDARRRIEISVKGNMEKGKHEYQNGVRAITPYPMIPWR